MSAVNSIVRDGREPDAPAGATGFQMPPELAARYDVRVVDGANGEQRIGLFRPTDRETPSIEITDERVVARNEDAETVAALVTIAKANGWDRIAVEGSPEFRQAIWNAATREGLTVSGYEPGSDEQARVEQARRDASARRERGTREQTAPTGQVDVGKPAVTPEATSPVKRGEALVTAGRSLSDGDDRLLLRISARADDRYRIAETLEMEMPRVAREVQLERLTENQAALVTALDQALDSPALAEAFERAGYEPEALRRHGRSGEWDEEVANAIYLVRTGLHRDTLSRQATDSAIEIDGIGNERGGRTETGTGPISQGDVENTRAELPDRPADESRRESAELAELFLHDTGNRVGTDPRLARAREAQVMMEQHIGEVFDGDRDRMTAAALESRQMISDALRRGLDVSVREPTPVRQIEPGHARPEMER